jgi:transposase-like protein
VAAVVSVVAAFAQETPEAASAQWRAVADRIRPKVPKLAAILDDAKPDVLASMTFPKEHRAKLQHQPDRAPQRRHKAATNAVTTPRGGTRSLIMWNQ